jgi:putative chitinase
MIDAKTLTAIGVPQATADTWLEPLINTMQKHDITTPVRIAMFLSQLAHESGNFRAVSENLNYSAEALRRVFGRHFPTDEIAAEYARKPERIANRAYANRMGNGDEASGDGWKYRGRGLIQLTGTNNYAAYSMEAKNNALTDPDIVATPEYAADSAGWFWASNRLNQLSDTGDVRAVTRRINGGFNGLADREQKYNKLIAVLGGEPR